MSTVSVQSYLDGLAKVCREPYAVDDTLAAWGTPEARDALAFYVRGARRRRMRFVNNHYGKLMGALGPSLANALAEDYLAHHAGSDPDWSGNLERFVQRVHAWHEAGRLPASAVELANHMAALHKVRRLPTPPRWTAVEALALNPTLEVLQHAHDWPSWLQGDMASLPLPSGGAILLAYYQKPDDQKPYWRRLDDGRLGLLRIVAESMSLADAAAATGLPEDGVRGRLQAEADAGLFVAADAG